MKALALLILAALLEIAGCFAVWGWWRLGRPGWWLAPALLCLLGFAWLLAQSPVAAAGRTFAIYGGIYITASLAWLWAVEGQRPDLWDLAGGAVCLIGAALILLGPRAA